MHVVRLMQWDKSVFAAPCSHSTCVKPGNPGFTGVDDIQPGLGPSLSDCHWPKHTGLRP